MLTVHTKRHIDAARQVLVGKVPDPKSQIEQITNALVYKFMDDMDEQSAALGGKRRYFTGNYEKYGWQQIMAERLGAHDRLALYREALETMSKNPGLPELFRSIFRNAYLPFNDARTLTFFLTEINYFSYENSEELGNGYEYLLSIMGSQGDAGQFRTPRHIIDFIVDCINPTKNDSVLDPACGTAGFLISAYKHVVAKHDDQANISGAIEQKTEGVRLTADERHKIYQSYHGFDIDDNMVKMAKVNMYLHSFPEPNIVVHDSLSSEDYWQEHYDVILANPPFMTPKGGIEPHKKFGIQANRAEVLFVDYIASHLKPTGRAGIVVPEGVIFQSGKAYRELRKNLIENYLYAVVSLPAGVFQPYSAVKTSILLLDKQLASQRDEILFVKVENDGLSLGAQRQPIVGNQLPEAYKVISQNQSTGEVSSTLAHRVSRQQITASGDYNLSGDRYKLTPSKRQSTLDFLPLSEIAEIYQPKTITSKDIQATGDYKVYGANGAIGYYHNYNHEKSEVLVTCRGATCGTVNFSEPKSWITGNAMVIAPKNETILNKRYLFYVLHNTSLKGVISGSAQPQITRAALAPYAIPVPPIEVQRAIVAELNGYQAIASAAQTIVTTYQPIIEINPTWQRAKIGDIATLMTGGTPSRAAPQYWQGGNVPWLVSGDIHKGVIRECAGRITELAVQESNARPLPQNSVLIALNGQGKTRGTVALLKAAGFTCNQSLVAITPKSPAVLAEFLYYQLKMMYQSIRNINGDNQRGGLNMPLIRNITLSIPPIETQQKIITALAAEATLITSNRKLAEIYQQKIASKLAEIWGE